jgi:UDP-N-acetylglucosamine diphosphorylase/glucosamine-1-phosphate N-acetyltransferase
MNYILFDDSSRNSLLPLTFTRPIAEIRIGILTIREKWEKMLGGKTSTLTEPYLSGKFPLVKGDVNTLINASVCPTNELVDVVLKLKPNQFIISGETIIAYQVTEENLGNDESSFDDMSEDNEQKVQEEIIEYSGSFLKINNTWEIFSNNEQEIISDFQLLTNGRKSAKLSETNTLIGDASQLFIEEGAVVEGAIINVKNGPVYIGENSEVMEGSLIRGSFALCAHSHIKMGAKIYGGTTVGPYSKVGGELNNVVIFGYTNKAHDGFFGNSVIGEWCNIGADSNTSNLKNTYDNVRLWNYASQTFINTNLQFCGAIIGDHSKCGINTMFNTGSVVGVCANVFGSGYQRNFIPSYAWGGTAGLATYSSTKAIDVAKRVWERRGVEFTEEDKKILDYVFHNTHHNRKLRF